MRKILLIIVIFTSLAVYAADMLSVHGQIFEVEGASKATDKYQDCDVYEYDGTSQNVIVKAYMNEGTAGVYIWGSGSAYYAYSLYKKSTRLGSTTYSSIPSVTYEGKNYGYLHTYSLSSSKLQDAIDNNMFVIKAVCTVSSTSTQTHSTNTIYIRKAALVKHTVTFDANGGTIPAGGNMGTTPTGHSTSLNEDHTIGTVEVTKGMKYFARMLDDCPSRESYTFEGWYTDPTSGEQVYDNTGYRAVGTYWNSDSQWIGTSNVTLYAHWNPIPYTITFVDADGNTIGTPQVVDYGQSATPPTPPTRNGYTFAGWIGNYQNVTGDATIYASYYKNSEASTVQPGALDGVFSISPTEKVLFSQGNLQYNAATGTHQCADGTVQQGTWRFAEHQYDTLGISQTQKAENYAGWVSAFAWGTSGWNSGANAYQPWAVSGDNYYDYYPGGDYTNDLTGAYENADWGVYNAIFNGGNQPRKWRTLSKDEWQYILNDRPNAKQLCSFVKVKNIPGMILLPDDFVLPDGLSFIPGETEANTNYSESEWLLFELNGAVFLPVDMLYSFSLGHEGWGTANIYYTSTHGGNSEERHAYSVYVKTLSLNSGRYRCDGGQVRVACAVPPTYAIIVQPNDVNAGTTSGSGSFYKGKTQKISAIPAECYEFVQWSDGNTDNPRTIMVTEDATYTAEFEKIAYTVKGEDSAGGKVKVEK
jgi:uncharacterized repeat protein (TIGR02543 family)